MTGTCAFWGHEMRFFFLRPRHGRRLAALSVLLFQVVHLAAPAPAFAAPPAAPAGAPGGFRVVIDAGHGGSDPGTISPLLPLREKDVALRMALLTGAALQRRGVEVAYTRTDDRLVPLGARAALASRTGAQALVSFHLNSAPSPDVSGAEAWYGASRGSDELAGAVLAALAGPLRAAGVRIRGTREGSDLVVLRVPVPAVLVEVGYVTNAADATALSRDAVLAGAADAAAGGIVSFLQTYRPEPARTVGLAGVAGTYFVQPGDTLGAIAARLGLPLEQLTRLNPTSVLQALLPGQPLHLPASEETTPSPATPQRQTSAGAAGSAAATGGATGGSTGGATYTVRPGDTLSEIALRTGRPAGELARLNGLSDPGLVLAGQTLRLGEGSSASSASASEGRLPLAVGSGAAVSGGRYRVQPGDTLSEVALRLGISAQALAQANGVVDPDRLIAGRALVVPGP